MAAILNFSKTLNIHFKAHCKHYTSAKFHYDQLNTFRDIADRNLKIQKNGKNGGHIVFFQNLKSSLKRSFEDRSLKPWRASKLIILAISQH